MPKKKKAGKNRKTTNGVIVEKRKLIIPDINGQTFGVIEKALGSMFYTVTCLDGVARRCKIRKKRMRVSQGDVVVISLRDFDDKNGDIIYKYTPEEVRLLQKQGNLPTSESMGIRTDINDSGNDDDCAFDFEDI